MKSVLEIRDYILEKITPYCNMEKVEINQDYVILDTKMNLSFDVNEVEVVLLFLTDHLHFDNYTQEDKSDLEYVEKAINCLIDLLTYEIKHIEYFKGSKLSKEKYYIFKNDEYIHISTISWFRFVNPFAKKSQKETIWKYKK